jgi:chemotaxis protein CheX
MHFGDEAARGLVESVWAQVLGMDIYPDVDTREPPGGESWLLGRVEIRGAWEGIVVLACPAGLTRAAAGVLFDTPAQDVTVEQVLDALEELTNILGGNLKALLPGPSALGLPVVAETASPDTESDGPALYRAAFRCRDERLVLAVVERGRAEPEA